MLFYCMGLVIDLKMCNLQEIIGFLTKIQIYLDLYNDRAITQHAPKCVENCSDH